VRTLSFLAFILFSTHDGFGYDTLRTTLVGSWQKYDDKTGFNSFKNDTKVIHLELPNGNQKFIEIKQRQTLSVFFNDQLILTNQRKVLWPIDSLKARYPTKLRISILPIGDVNDLVTNAIVIVDDQNKRPADSNFQSYVIIVSVLLLTALIVLSRTSPQATLEYFNVLRIFSIRNIEEGAVTTRVTSVNNIFVYIFCSALAAVNILAFSKSTSLSTIGFDNYLVGMFYMTLIVFLVVILKILTVNTFSRLFRLTEFAPGQCYNFVRLLLIGFSITSIILVGNFMLKGNLELLSPFLTGFMVSLLLSFTAVTYIKLNTRGGFTVFHLFSYLCASEIIPLIILLNIYFS
jgi:hypothetical protein